LEGVEGIVDRRRCARAMLVVQLRERYRRLITRGIVTFNFSPILWGQGDMIRCACV